MAAPVEAGQILAEKYRVDKVLGEGGMGVVVAATDLQLERVVAIKFLLPEYLQHKEAAQRFMREARSAVKIHSEHIARVIDINTMPNGSPYMVMEYLQGADLSQVLEQRGRIPIEEAVLYVLEACDAVAEAHAYGIVHRDLKPANLFLANQADGSSKIKVLDFGISKSTIPSNSGLDAALTRTSSMMGSPLYMSPEQMRSTRDVDARTDIWALGIILYELITGALPFEAQSIPELSAKILLEPPTPITRHYPGMNRELEAIVMRALEKDPKTRFASVSDFAIALLKFAPKKARTNVERITKLQRQAGVSQSLPQLTALPESAPGFPAEKRRYDATITGFGHSVAGFDTQNKPQIPTNKVGKWIAIGAVGLVVLLGGLAIALFGGSDDTADQPPPVGVPVQAAAAASSASPVPAAVTIPTKPTEVRPLEEPRPEPEPEKPTAPTTKPETATRPAKKPVAQETQPTNVGKPIIILQPKPTAQPAPAPTRAETNDLNSPFGGRK
jgi:serine/threonine-protein kinase